MRIAQIAPLIESVPPRLYGGTERIVSYLTDELVRQGHDVTLFASGNSRTSAELHAVCEASLRLTTSVRDPIPYYMVLLEQVRQRAHEFDVLHFHIDQFHFPIFNDTPSVTLTTLHGRQDLPDLGHLYASFPSMPLVSISQAQRRPIHRATFAGTVLHGLPPGLLPFTGRTKGGYLAFLGRISPEKGVDRAIAIAQAVGMPIRIAAKVDRSDEAYFQSIAGMFELPHVDFVGEIDDRGKARFLGDAEALLFPIAWPEPFGLVMIEAMACGTPVLAFRNGSVREVVDPGVTGAIVSTVEEAVAALPDVLALDRKAVRQQFETRFSAERMASDYVAIYRSLLAGRCARSEIELPPPVHKPIAVKPVRARPGLDGIATLRPKPAA